jgi:hypothetical protein
MALDFPSHTIPGRIGAKIIIEAGKWLLPTARRFSMANLRPDSRRGRHFKMHGGIEVQLYQPRYKKNNLAS